MTQNTEENIYKAILILITLISIGATVVAFITE